jgi:hypothetical protein
MSSLRTALLAGTFSEQEAIRHFCCRDGVTSFSVTLVSLNRLRPRFFKSRGGPNRDLISSTISSLALLRTRLCIWLLADCFGAGMRSHILLHP